MIIAVPSKGRAGITKTDIILPSATFFVPKSEVADYLNAGVKKVVGVDDDVKGITKTRNWILNNVNERRVVMVDDDVKTQGYRKLNERNSKHIHGNEEFWLKECRKLFDITEQMDYRIWGVATVSSLMSVYPYRPFQFKGYITASFMGIVNDGRTMFDESFPVKEDYELNLRCMKEDGGVVCARYLYWENEHWETEGGCKEYRTDDMEKEMIAKLQQMYPNWVRQKTSGGSDFSISVL